MTRLRVKVCGLTRPEDAALAAALGADAVGFVFWPKSPRAIAPERARALAAALPPFVTRVGVFVDAGPEAVAETVAAARLDAAQLHGEEVVEGFANAAPRLIKAVAIETEADVERALQVPADVTVLIDAADRERRGGTGRRANWTLAAEVARRRSVILAGGLTPEVVGEAVRVVRPWAVDVSSGVEAAPGVKDAGKLRAFFAAIARRATEAT